MSNRKRKLVIFGCGGHAKCVVDCAELQEYFEIVGFVDDFKPIGSKVCGYEVLGPCSAMIIHRLIESGVECGVIAIGDNSSRSKVAAKIYEMWPSMFAATLIHPTAFVSRSALIGEGSVVFPGAIVHVDCRIGRHCIVNSRALLEHDSVMGDFSALAPGAIVLGSACVGTFSWIASGATVLQGRTVGENTVVGAGAVVIRNIPSFVVAFGIPAKPMRSRTTDEKYL
jgi:sugar O-acyltransferase (sialic acid O-acetyltransferase NeuD family)